MKLCLTCWRQQIHSMQPFLYLVTREGVVNHCGLGNGFQVLSSTRLKIKIINLPELVPGLKSYLPFLLQRFLNISTINPLISHCQAPVSGVHQQVF